MGFDHVAWPLDQDADAESAASEGRLDWHGLRARFLAARACHGALAAAATIGEVVTDASFDRSTARTLAGFDEGLHGINQRDSADSKDASGNNENVVGASMRGDRG